MCVVSRGKEEGGSTGVQLCSPLPERDINKVISEPVGLIKSDAMLYCYDDWNPEQPVDARGMSDGTLRFIAIVVALLAVAPHSLLLIEEVDPSCYSHLNFIIKILTGHQSEETSFALSP